MHERHLIVGTAGHIDHGKSALVRALTGIDPDRLKEEKERGITIDLGFADTELAPGRVVSFVDVPGHERFVRHMIAGASGIDAVLLVVAADEGVSAQTREHVHIATLLGLRAGLVALTKSDVADPEMREVVALEVREFLKGTALDGAPVIEVSAKTGQGLDRLREALGGLFDRLPDRPEGGLPRLAVDRAFVLRGFGTVVTGTLASGRLEVGQEIEILPGGRRARIRGLQVHRRSVTRARAGQRVAVNLQGVARDEVPRGTTLVAPGSLAPTRRIVAEVAWLEHAPERLRRSGIVRFHQGTCERNARLRALAAASGPAGALYVVQLEAPTVLLPGDRFILRLPAPVDTVGGGIVRDIRPPRHVRAEEYAQAEGDRERLGRHLRRAGRAGAALAQLGAAVGMRPEEAAEVVEQLVAEGRAVRFEGHVFDAQVWGEIWEAVEQFLARVHRGDPLATGYPREALRGHLCPEMPQEAWRAGLQARAAQGKLALAGEYVALADHRVVLSREDQAVVERLERSLRDAGLDPPPGERWLEAEPEPQRARRLVEWLAGQGRIVRLGDGRWIHADVLGALRARLAEHARRSKRIDVATFKELAGVSRRSAIPLLEYLDAARITRRVGNEREILLSPGDAREGAGVPRE